MRTPLEKALGLQEPETPSEADALMLLALKGKCAGDTYYFNMDQPTFDEVMRGNENEDFYRFYTKQRAIGVEALKAETVRELAACSGEELHEIVQCHNYDSGKWLIMQIISHQKCEFATALTIYWANQAYYHYTQYESLEEASQDPKNFSRESAMFLNKIEKRAKLKEFSQTLPIPDRSDLSHFFDGKKPDYTKKPWNKIPVELQI